MEKVDTEETQTEETQTENISTEGLSPEEISMAQDHGLIDKPAGDEDKKTDEETDETDVTEKVTEDKKEEKEEDRPTFEEMAEDPEKEQKVYDSFNKNEQGLYFKYKKERSNRQNADRENELLRVKLSANEKKKDSDKKNEDEDLQDEDFVTRGELKKAKEKEDEETQEHRKKQAEVSERLNLQEAEAKSKHDDFDDVLLLAKNVMNNDKYGVYAQKMVAIGADPDGNVAEYLYDLGKTHSDYKSGNTKTKDKTKINKMIANSQKKTSSATVGAGGSARVTSEDELKAEDVGSYSTDEWSKLKPETRNRILKSTC